MRTRRAGRLAHAAYSVVLAEAGAIPLRNRLCGGIPGGLIRRRLRANAGVVPF